MQRLRYIMIIINVFYFCYYFILSQICDHLISGGIEWAVYGTDPARVPEQASTRVLDIEGLAS